MPRPRKTKRSNSDRQGPDPAGPAGCAIRLAAASRVYGSVPGFGLTESPIPSISPTAVAGLVGVAALLGWSSIMVPTGAVMRTRPVDAIGVRE